MFIGYVTSIWGQLNAQKGCDGELKDFKAKQGNVMCSALGSRVKNTNIHKSQNVRQLTLPWKFLEVRLYLLFSVWGL